MNKIRLITFDVTQTLLNFKHIPGQNYEKMAAQYGIKADPIKLNKSMQKYFISLSIEHPHYGFQTIGWKQWWINLVTKTFQDSTTINNTDASKIANELISKFEKADCWTQTSGSIELLTYLGSRNLPIGVLSNFDPRLPVILQNMKMEQFFKFVLYSYEIGASKPDKRIFEEALKRSGVVGLKPDEAMHIGNSIELDYVGAKEAGWNAILIKPKDVKSPLVDCKDVFCSLNDFQNYFVQTSGK